MDHTTLIEVESVSRYYGALCAVDKINFCLQQPQIVGLLGVNGAGKSSLLKMLSGQLHPSQGRIRICGDDIVKQAKTAKAKLGYVPQFVPLYGDLSVTESLRFCAQLYGIQKANQHAAIDRALQFCDLHAVARRRVATLSRGYQQRLGIAQAIVHQPRVLILDEPTVGLDPLQNNALHTLIQQLGEQHAVIVSTHILAEAQHLCQRVIILNQGKKILDESASTLQQRWLQPRSLLLAFESPPPLELLRQLDDIEEVQALEQSRYRVRYKQACNPAARLVEMSVQHQWGLYELVPEQPDLQHLFLDLHREASTTSLHDLAIQTH